MKRRICVWMVLIVLVLSVSVQAVELRYVTAQPSLSFNGTVASCSAICREDSSNDKIDATLTLYQGSSYVDSWSGSGKDRGALSGTCEAVSGKSYTLVVDYSVNGELKPSVYTTRTYP